MAKKASAARRRNRPDKAAVQDPDVVRIRGTADGNAVSEIARAYLSPAVQAGTVVRAYTRLPDGGGPDVNALVAQLHESVDAAKAGDLREAEAMLISQAQSLSAIFTSLAEKASRQQYLQQYEAHLQLALKAQAQCRATLETLAEVRYPRQMQVVRQQNVAVNQQVNGCEHVASNSRARGAEAKSTNELLEILPSERLEPSAPRKAGDADSAVAALAPLNGAEDA
jgi:hypothetical protein